MSLYNMINGVNSAAFIFLPMLGKHPDEFPRFRDCFIGDNERPETEGKLIIYTRTGGGNRDFYECLENCKNNYPEHFEDGQEMSGPWNADIRAIEGFLYDYDDNFDCTYAHWVFDIPAKWKDDFKRLRAGDGKEISDEYKDQMKAVYPKLADKFDVMFSNDAS